MRRSEVEAILMEALQEVQGLGGHEWHAMDADREVIGVLEGFDSLTGIEATAIVEEKLTKKLGRLEPIALGISSFFVSSDGRKALTLSAVVSTVCAALDATA
jgi:hypothetical protein